MSRHRSVHPVRRPDPASYRPTPYQPPPGWNERVTMSITNVNGGAVALGHPYGMSGIRYVGSTLLELPGIGPI